MLGHLIRVSVLSVAAAACTHTPPSLSTFAGHWEGEAIAGEATLPFAIQLAQGLSGWSGIVDVPSQYALSYQLADLSVDSPVIVFAFPDNLPPTWFEGMLEGSRIRGRFSTVNGADTIRGTFALRRRVPEALPYGVTPVRFRNDELELVGTVLRPQSSGPHPAVVLVHGSGPQTRDSYLHWFADQFARSGFVALIYDKRGTGESGGLPWPQTVGSFADLAGDAAAGVRFLLEQTDVDPQRIGVWGLSQGAWIAPLVAARASGLVRFLILVSGGGATPAEQELYDDEVKLLDQGFSREEIEEALSYLRLADQYVRTTAEEDWQRFDSARIEARAKPWYSYLDRFPQVLPREAPAWTGLRADLDYDPTPVLSTLTVPVLLILGSEDRLTPVDLTSRRVREAVARAGNSDLTIRVIPGADHALLVSPTELDQWLAQRPAFRWVSNMVSWAIRHR